MVESRSISHSVQPVLTCVSPAQQLGGACDLYLVLESGERATWSSVSFLYAEEAILLENFSRYHHRG